MSRSTILLIIICIIVLYRVSHLSHQEHAASFNIVHARRAIMSSDSLGNQPIVLVTHVHSPKLSQMWNEIQWTHGEKVVVCDCDRSTAEKFGKNMIQVIVDRDHTKKHLVNSLDQPRVEWKAWDTTVSFLSRRTFHYAWIIEYDVMFEPKELSKILKKYVNDKADFIGGTGSDKMKRGPDWLWHQKNSCHHEFCNNDAGSFVSFCRVSKRLIDESVRLSAENRHAFLEKLFPSLCVHKNWRLVTLSKTDVAQGYSNGSAKACDTTKLPLHKCTNHI